VPWVLPTQASSRRAAEIVQIGVSLFLVDDLVQVIGDGADICGRWTTPFVVEHYDQALGCWGEF